MNWMRGRAKELGMKPVAVDLISSLRDGEISPVLELIEKHRNGGMFMLSVVPMLGNQHLSIVLSTM